LEEARGEGVSVTGGGWEMNQRITVHKGATITITQPGYHDEVKEALRDLLRFKHTGDKRIFNKKNVMYEKGDEECDFFTEGYLYPLFEDKDAARSLLGRVSNVITALGYTDEELYP
jgi:hypothetical protein